jgi:transcriptional regulator of acetoin/glycerol metabolism
MASNRPMIQTPPSLSPLGRALLDSIREGVVVFDTDGRVLYANQEGQRSIANGSPNGSVPGKEELLPRLSAMGARILPLRVPDSQAGAAAVIPPKADRGRTLAERERQAIIDTLEATQGKLAETARRLGISRTTLWRRLREYGLKQKNEGFWRARAAS